LIGKLSIYLIQLFLVVGLIEGFSLGTGIVELPGKADLKLAFAAEQGASVLYLPITLKGLASPNDTIFGVQMERIGGQKELEAVTAVETGWVRRGSLLWSAVEPTEGTYLWDSLAALEQEFITASRNGLRIILVVRSTPGWAQEYHGVSCGPIKEDKLAAFGEFLYQAVKRYSVPPYNVKYWQIWNEEDIYSDLVFRGYLESDSGYGCWGDSSDPYGGGGDYADVLQVVYPRIKSANPEAQLVVGGMLMTCNPEIEEVCTSKEANYFEGILHHHGADDGQNYFDVVAFHAYDYYFGRIGKFGNRAWESRWDLYPALTMKAAYLKRVMERYNVDKPLIVTETALLCGSDGTESICTHPDFENTKAAYLAQSYVAAIANGIQSNVWYALTGKWRANSLLDSDLEPLPAYFAYTNVVNSLKSVVFNRELNEYPEVKGYEFDRGDYRIWFVWSRVEDQYFNILPVQMDLPAEPIKVWDVFGKEVPVNASGITVTGMPVYIALPKP